MLPANSVWVSFRFLRIAALLPSQSSALDKLDGVHHFPRPVRPGNDFNEAVRVHPWPVAGQLNGGRRGWWLHRRRRRTRHGRGCIRSRSRHHCRWHGRWWRGRWWRQSPGRREFWHLNDIRFALKSKHDAIGFHGADGQFLKHIARSNAAHTIVRYFAHLGDLFTTKVRHAHELIEPATDLGFRWLRRCCHSLRRCRPPSRIEQRSFRDLVVCHRIRAQAKIGQYARHVRLRATGSRAGRGNTRTAGKIQLDAERGSQCEGQRD